MIYGDGQWGEVHAYDPVTLTQKWEIKNPDHGVTDIAVFDTDGDGALEIIWGERSPIFMTLALRCIQLTLQMLIMMVKQR